MVNGFVSRGVYLGAWGCVALYMIGAFLLAGVDRSAPAELDKVLYVALGIVGGSHIVPPISRKATERAVAETERVTEYLKHERKN